jgi:hypothetical protein
MREPAAVLVHDLPGRVRFSIGGIKGHPVRASAVAARLLDLPGVLAARANPLTGSLIVEHDGVPGRREAVLSAVEASGPVVLARHRESGIAEMLATALVERLLERALHAAVAAII